MIEKPYLVHWSDDSDHNTEIVATLDEAQIEIDRWLDLRRGEADDGWSLDMTGCIAVIVERVVEEESEAPEGSSFDRHVDYHREKAPDPRDARIAALEGEVSRLQSIVDVGQVGPEAEFIRAVHGCAPVGWCPACGPRLATDEDGCCLGCGATATGAGATRALTMEAEVKRLRAIAQEVEKVLGEGASPRDVRRAFGEPAPMRLPSVDEVSARVHEAWMESKRRAGVTSRKLEGGEELMVPYADLSEQAKELDRATVRAVYAAIGDAEAHQPAPLRLGRGPTDDTEESIGVRMIAAERQRQIVKEGWTSAHDDEHAAGEMASAAACYAGQVFTPTKDPPPGWPWERRWWKPKGGRIRVLVKAGALIAAEIDRLVRAGEKP